MADITVHTTPADANTHTPPHDWIDFVCNTLPGADRIELAWRVGRSKYAPIPDYTGSIRVTEIDGQTLYAIDKSKQCGGETFAAVLWERIMIQLNIAKTGKKEPALRISGRVTLWCGKTRLGALAKNTPKRKLVSHADDDDLVDDAHDNASELRMAMQTLSKNATEMAKNNTELLSAATNAVVASGTALKSAADLVVDGTATTNRLNAAAMNQLLEARDAKHAAEQAQHKETPFSETELGKGIGRFVAAVLLPLAPKVGDLASTAIDAAKRKLQG